MGVNSRHLTLAAVLSAGIACGHGPPERSVSIGDYDTPNGVELTIALRGFDVIRPARGLSAIPDGGVAITVDQGVELDLCRKADGAFRQIAVVHEPSDSSRPTLATPTIVAWLDTAVRISSASGKSMDVPLPADLRVGTAPKQRFERRVLPECAKALDELRRSSRMPDGTPVTPR